MLSFYLSATRKSSGKTTLSLGLCRALANRSWKVQTFKKGPDYIDSMWLTRASHRPCINLDFNTMGQEELLQRYAHYNQGADISIIEGNKGLYDGLDLLGRDSNAELCRVVHAPVILVIDAQGMTRGVAPLRMGYQQFDDSIEFAGVVFNRTGGERHERKLREVTEHYTDFNVLGCIPNQRKEMVAERHMGLVTDLEIPWADSYIDRLATLVSDHVDVHRLIDDVDLAGRSRRYDAKINNGGAADQPAKSQRYSRRLTRLQSSLSSFPITIGIARDSAFCFYYQDDLDAMVEAGVDIIEFNTLCDAQLPEVDGIFIGGGFPETHAQALEANTAMRQSLREFAELGKPIYGECGGLMYLSRSISWASQEYEMVGLIPADTVFHERPVGRGYVKIVMNEHHPWARRNEEDSGSEDPIQAHEFHYSSLENMEPDLRYGYQTLRGHGIDGKRDGLVVGNVVASYAHLRHSDHHPWVFDFIDQIYHSKRQRIGLSSQSTAYH